ncbi:ABC transporter substrate-binding protein [Clostridium sp. SHJSY1]|uniref:ABC transporter substrate-binding protein n=1 Tax=Clostridium sp. SHJSY1 TaxID=2942483 RepID=UPI0028761FFD|nr:ABC transporter substrate-binding protein [Clostridium sp. SHJSY1]MDS0527736.1 ABC transporter substrate-binding protein [Clostridium sp. SHJSY1]
MKKRILSLVITALVGVTSLSGCGALSNKNGENTNGEKEIVFWHSMGGAGGEAINEMVDKFNKENKSNIKVTAQYQGEYDDAINKIKSSKDKKSYPDVMQLYDIGTRWMIDSKMATPIQKFIDDDKYDTSSLEKNLLAYYTVDDKLNSMPFNSSTPILYYNKNAFKEVGLDPDKAPTNFDEIKTYSEKLTKKDGNNITQYGYSMAIYGWFFEQFLAEQLKSFANNGNGRDSKATAVDFKDNGGGVTILKTWKDLYDKGLLGNFGRKTDDTQQAFIAGKTAMFIDSTASLNSVLKGINGKFEVGTAFLPKISKEDKGGVSIGGGSLWILNKDDETKQKAAFEFIKFMVSPEEQVYWNEKTGYFPVTTKAYDLQEMKDHLVKTPQFKTAIDQLHASPVESRGALLGVFPEARQKNETNIEAVLQGKISPEEAIEESEKSINSAIEKYNKANK